MTPFQYREQELYCEDVSLRELAEEYGTPLYVYSKNAILEQYRAFDAALGGTDHRVCYALKANANLAILGMLAAEGAGADVVSAGEMYLAKKAGFPPDRTVFAGVGKREDEIELALREKIACFNVESVEELQAISRAALRLGTTARIAIRINPDIDAQSHPYITTGLRANKFGIPAGQAIEVFTLAASLPGIDVHGVHTHIGSQITTVEPFVATAQYVAGLVSTLREAGIHLQQIDFGGGIGVRYFNAVRHEAIPSEDKAHDQLPEPAAFIAAVLPILSATGCRLWVEPGRAIIAEAGALLTRVLYIKESGEKRFIIVDAAMTELIRPSLYHAHHQIVPTVLDSFESIKADVVGPVCETGDFFARDRMIPKLRPQAILAILTAGAYGYVLASQYNGRLRPAEILVNGDRVRLVRPRETYEIGRAACRERVLHTV
jgi:diaminopimelate decarboxylase